ncbi:MAG: hypothetical protein AABW73_04080 [Nanoarchaeota archaeon]
MIRHKGGQSVTSSKLTIWVIAAIVLVIVLGGIMKFGILEKIYGIFPDYTVDDANNLIKSQEDAVPIQEKTSGDWASINGRIEDKGHLPIIGLEFDMATGILEYGDIADNAVFRWNPDFMGDLSMRGRVQVYLRSNFKKVDAGGYRLSPTSYKEGYADLHETSRDYINKIMNSDSEEEMFENIYQVTKNEPEHIKVMLHSIYGEYSRPAREISLPESYQKLLTLSHKNYVDDVDTNTEDGKMITGYERVVIYPNMVLEETLFEKNSWEKTKYQNLYFYSKEIDAWNGKEKVSVYLLNNKIAKIIRESAEGKSESIDFHYLMIEKNDKN